MTDYRTPFRATSEKEAWMACMMACMPPIEGNRMHGHKIGLLAITIDVFDGEYDSVLVGKTMNIRSYQGWKSLIDGSKEFVRYDSRDTLFAQCAELGLIGGNITQEQRDKLNYLSLMLQLDMDLAERIVEVIMIKNRRDFKKL